MKRHNKLQSRQSQETEALSQQEFTIEQVREFAHAEDLLRHDSLHTPVPPSLAYRLRESIRAVPEKPRPWWRRLFGK